MATLLNPHEARALGVLIEKALTTPEQYPLSLNALTNGCNQKSNRDPVVDYGEAEVTVALTGLQMKHLAGGTIPAGSRVERWHHSAKEHLELDERGLAVLAELLLRGPQAPGELRTRASRMRTFSNLEELSHTLRRLEEQGYVKRVRGSRAERFAQTLCEGEAEAAAPGASASAPDARPAPSSSAGSGVPPAPAGAGTSHGAPLPQGGSADLAQRVARLERQLADLAAQLGVELGD